MTALLVEVRVEDGQLQIKRWIDLRCISMDKVTVKNATIAKNKSLHFTAPKLTNKILTNKVLANKMLTNKILTNKIFPNKILTNHGSRKYIYILFNYNLPFSMQNVKWDTFLKSLKL